MWSSGSFKKPTPNSEEAKFSDRLWGRTAGEYLRSIIDLEEPQWDAIIKKADLCARGVYTDSDDESDEDGDYNPDDISATGGRAVIQDHVQVKREAYLRGDKVDADMSMSDGPQVVLCQARPGLKDPARARPRELGLEVCRSRAPV